MLADGDAQGQVGEVYLRTGKAFQVIGNPTIADLQAIALGVHLQAVVLIVGELAEQLRRLHGEPGADGGDNAIAETV